MSETVTLVAQLSAGWRVLLVANRPGWGRPTWLLQNMVDGAWCDVALTRASGMLREIVLAKAGTVDAETAAILRDLPTRCDIREPGSPPKPKRKKRAAEAKAPVNPPTPEPAVRRMKRDAGGAKRAAVVAAFMQWRSQKEEARS
jgi:hypothetical protein